MAYTLTTDELIEQAKMLTTKTNEATNANMVYSKTASRNMALNPDYFSAVNSSIVNALNLVMKNTENNKANILTTTKKLGSTLGDTSNSDINEQFENLKKMMGKDTIIEGLADLYSKNIVTEEKVTSIVSDTVETTVETKLSWENTVGGDS